MHCAVCKKYVNRNQGILCTRCKYKATGTFYRNDESTIQGINSIIDTMNSIMASMPANDSSPNDFGGFDDGNSGGGGASSDW